MAKVPFGNKPVATVLLISNLAANGPSASCGITAPIISSLHAFAIVGATNTGSGLIEIVIVNSSPIQASELTGFTTYTTSFAVAVTFVNLSSLIAVADKPVPNAAFPLAAIRSVEVTDTNVQLDADTLDDSVDKVIFVISSLHTAVAVDKLANVTGSGLIVTVIILLVSVHATEFNKDEVILL